MTQRAVFFDRDDTLIVDKHYMHRPEDLEYFPDTFTSLTRLTEAGYQVFIVTNQSGIGRGMFTEDDMHKVHAQMLEDFKKEGIAITDIAFCPHAPEDQCSCRKPEPKLILDLAQKYNTDLAQSYMVGDKNSDVEAGQRAGTVSLLFGKEEFPNLTSVVDHILKKTL